jgi:acyl carrier protein
MVAYLISKQALNLAGIRNYLREKLPAYMVPAHFIQLENLPLTFNGKLDKKSLPGPDAINRPADIEFIAPANEIEEKVLDIWRMILQRENIGVKDVFFDIGGNSLKLVMLHKKLSQAFPGKIALTDLFDQTTIQKISNYLRRDTSAEQIQSINI